MTTVQTLAELVAIDSVSVRPNAEIANYLAGRCEELGLTVKRFPYRDDNNLEKFNLVALAGEEFSTKPKVELALALWTRRVRHERLYCRSAWCCCSNRSAHVAPAAGTRFHRRRRSWIARSQAARGC